MQTIGGAHHYKWEDVGKDSPMDLLERKKIVGRLTMIAQVQLQKGCKVPTHAHENEQFACVLSGRIRFGLGPDGAPNRAELVLGAGEVLQLPPNVLHSAEALEDTLVLDIFTPTSEKTGIDR